MRGSKWLKFTLIWVCGFHNCNAEERPLENCETSISYSGEAGEGEGGMVDAGSMLDFMFLQYLRCKTYFSRAA